jgi:hypothetical protein
MRTRRALAARAAVIVATAAIAVSGGCRTVSVSADWDQKHDFRGYRTFGWLHGEQPETGDFRIDNPLIDKRIREAIDKTLQARGFKRVGDTGADFLVGYHLGLEKRLDVYTMNAYYGYRRGGVSYPQTQVSEYEQGSLVIDIADTGRRTLVWRGTGTRRVSQSSSPEKSSKVFRKAVAEILDRFPPN